MSKKDLRNLFVDNVKIPRHDRDLLVSYMKLLDIANVDYTVDAKNDEYSLTLHIEPNVTTETMIGNGSVRVDSVDTIPFTHENLKFNGLGISEETLNENVAKAISNIENLSIDSAKIANIEITSAKIGNIPDLASVAGRVKVAKKKNLMDYYHVFSNYATGVEYWRKLTGKGYAKTVNGNKFAEITHSEYLEAFETYLETYDIQEFESKDIRYVKFHIAGIDYYYRRKVCGKSVVKYLLISLSQFEEAFSDGVFLRKVKDGTISLPIKAE